MSEVPLYVAPIPQWGFDGNVGQQSGRTMGLSHVSLYRAIVNQYYEHKRTALPVPSNASRLQGYLAHKKQRPPRTLQQDCA